MIGPGNGVRVFLAAGTTDMLRDRRAMRAGEEGAGGGSCWRRAPGVSDAWATG